MLQALDWKKCVSTVISYKDGTCMDEETHVTSLTCFPWGHCQAVAWLHLHSCSKDHLSAVWMPQGYRGWSETWIDNLLWVWWSLRPVLIFMKAQAYLVVEQAPTETKLEASTRFSQCTHIRSTRLVGTEGTIPLISLGTRLTKDKWNRGSISIFYGMRSCSHLILHWHTWKYLTPLGLAPFEDSLTHTSFL